MLRLFCAFKVGIQGYFCIIAYPLMKIKETFLLLLLFCTAFAATSQQTILDRFQANVRNGQVFLNWTIIQGSTCNGINIMRSIDSLNFFEIGDIEGVCGSLLEPVNYNFTDRKPFANRKNFYRLELGDVGSSKIITIEVISLNDEGFYVFPNPVDITTRIYFTNSRFQIAELKLFNINGAMGQQLFSQDDFFDLDLSGFNAGMYFFLIYTQDNSSPLSGKIIVQ